MTKIAGVPTYDTLLLWGRDDFKRDYPTVSGVRLQPETIFPVMERIWEDYDLVVATKIIVKSGGRRLRVLLSSTALGVGAQSYFSNGAGYFSNSDLPYFVKPEFISGFDISIYRAFLL